MISGLKALAGLFSLLNFLFELFQKWKLKREARAEAQADVAKVQADARQKTDEVLAEPRTDDDTARRLQDGKF